MWYAASVPTILRIGHLRVGIHTNEHPPPHVHVFGYGGEAVFNLNCPHVLPTFRDQYRLSDPEVNRMIRSLVPYIRQLCTTWEEMHGKQKPHKP